MLGDSGSLGLFVPFEFCGTKKNRNERKKDFKSSQKEELVSTIAFKIKVDYISKDYLIYE